MIMQPNCSELALNMEITNDDEMLDTIKYLAENMGKGWTLATKFSTKDEKVYIKMEPSDAISCVEVIKDEEEAVWKKFEVNIHRLIEKYSNGKEEKERLLELLSTKIPWKPGLVFATGIKENIMITKDYLTSVDVYPQDTYHERRGLTIQFNQHCETYKFPPLKRAKELVGGEIYGIDGGGTGDYENWEDYWSERSSNPKFSKEEKFLMALDEEIDGEYEKYPPIW